MKIDKRFFICAMLVLMLFLCVNASSATEPLNQTLGADAGDEIAASDASNVNLSASGDTFVVDGIGEGENYATISAAVSSATGGETIFIKNGTYTETARISNVNKQLTFTGESQSGVIIKSDSTSGFLYTAESGYTALTFNNLTFKNINGGTNAAIEIGGDGAVNINNCTFDSCYSRYGSLRIRTSGTAVIDGCKIINSQSSDGSYSSAIDFGGSSNTDYTVKNTIIDGSSISSANTATYIFGAIYSEKSGGTVILDNVTICNCNLEKSSGLIAAKGNMDIKRSKLVNNYVYRDLAIAGFIFVNGKKTITVESSMIANNTQPNYFLTANSAANFDLNYNNIQNNTFNTAFTNPTNGVYTLDANYWGSNTLPEGVTATTWVVEDNGEYKLNNGNPLEKEVPGLTDEGGDEPIVLPEGTIYMAENGDDAKDGSSEANAIASFTRAIEIVQARENKTVTVYILNGNYTTAAIDITEANITFIGQEKGKVVVHGTGKYIFDVYGDHLVSKFENIDFVDSRATTENNMGALRLYADYSDFTINNCNFRNISAKYGALDLQCDYGNVDVTNCVIENVTGSASMSAIIYIYGTETTYNFDNIEIKNCGLDAKYASENPTNYLRSIFYVQSNSVKTVTLINSRITNNYGPNYGGVIESKSKLTVENTIISDNVVNTSVNGNNGGKYLIWASHDNSDINMVNCIITNNTIVKSGNGLFYNQKGKINVEYSDISKNGS